jgi:hypothetical protein
MNVTRISPGHYFFESDHEYGEHFSGKILWRGDKDWRVIPDQLEGPSTVTQTLEDAESYLRSFETRGFYPYDDNDELSFVYQYGDNEEVFCEFLEEDGAWKIRIADIGVLGPEFETLLGAQLYVRLGKFDTGS